MPRNDEFFVGYLPAPPRLRRFLLAASGVVLLVLAGAAALIAARQRDPGDAVWNLSQRTSFEGVVYERPYPMLRMRGPGGEPATVLLVSPGKVGATEPVAGLDGQHVRASGSLLHRPLRSMIELDSRPEPIDGSEPQVAFSTPSAATEVTLRGEIIDPKCFLGAMKPGEGKTHKACATLCIRGGIPPVLLTFDSAGKPVDYLIVVEDIESIAPWIGDQIELRGTVVQQDDMRILRPEITSIRRL